MGGLGNVESGAAPSNTTPQNILAALADIQKQQPAGSSAPFGADGDNFTPGGKSAGNVGGLDDGGQSGAHGQLGSQQQLT